MVGLGWGRSSLLAAARPAYETAVAAARWLLVLPMVASCGLEDPTSGRGEPWPEADRMFHRDPRFRGGDAAFTIDLGAGRVLWLVGDSLIGTGEDRDANAFIRNSVGLQTGLDPTTAAFGYYWG